MFVADAPAQTLTVLVVEDDPELRVGVARGVAAAGWTALVAGDGMEALAVLREQRVDAVLLDRGLPFVDGLETCRRLRAAGDPVPVVLLCDRDGIDDRVAALDAGADDVVGKPFALREVLARVRAIHRRSTRGSAPAPVERHYADLRIDLPARQAYRGDRLLQLTRTEFLLLDQLAANAGHVIERSQLLLRVWGYDFGAESNSLGVYIGYLRRKTEAAGEPRLIHTVRNVGYVLREPG